MVAAFQFPVSADITVAAFFDRPFWWSPPPATLAGCG
jgi:hypothetical protein